nr:type II toxin-antitoxin system VapC family toxin [Candidatus Woesearchaeota archaeon]
MKRFYLDTSIWLDFFEKRGKYGKLALKLIRKIIQDNSIILYSDSVINELKRLGYGYDQIEKIFSIAKPNNIIKIHIFSIEMEEAKNLAFKRNIPRGDALNAILSRDNYAQLVARDYHYRKLKDISITKAPEELI